MASSSLSMLRDRVPTMLATFLTVAACSSAPSSPDDTLNTTLELYDDAVQTDGIFEHAGTSMGLARDHLRQASRLFEQSTSRDRVEHHSFMVRQHVAIAMARLRRAVAQEAIDHADETRRQVMLQARQREAAAASQRAEAAESRLSDTRMQLEMAEHRARTLAERLAALDGSPQRN